MDLINCIFQYFKLKISIVWLCILILISLTIYYTFPNIKPEILAVVLSPLFTLSILIILEEYKAKWNSKYEAFKNIYANRGSLLNEKSIEYLNSIDITFIDDKKVRKCWKELFARLTKRTEISAQKECEEKEKLVAEKTKLAEEKIKLTEEKIKVLSQLLAQIDKEINIKLVELINSMAISLGLNKDISYYDISESYTPAGFGIGKTVTEVNYYQAGSKFFENNTINSSNKDNN